MGGPYAIPWRMAGADQKARAWPERAVIIGNSGSGKSTLARAMAASGARGLDLDTIAWDPGPKRRSTQQSAADVRAFCERGGRWVVEGCYADLAAVALEHGPCLVFLNPGVDACVRHCVARPWEPHKYATKEEQEANLPMLLEWVRGYETRGDECSLAAHRALFEAYGGPKIESTEPGRWCP